jgi:hypothetical protein
MADAEEAAGDEDEDEDEDEDGDSGVDGAVPDSTVIFTFMPWPQWPKVPQAK